MKNLQLQKITLSLVFVLAICSYTLATIHTVDNNENSGSLFTDVQSAINAAAVGDTIIIAGSETAYPGFTLNKKLVLIGSGYNPQGNDQFAFVSTISGDVNIRNENAFQNLNASGSYIEGIYFGDSRYFRLGEDTQETLENITVTKCYFDNTQGWLQDIKGLLFYNNIVEGYISASSNNQPSDDPNYDQITNILIFNNIFTQSKFSFVNYSLINLSSNGIIVSNNIFLSGSTADVVMQNCNGLIFTNNIVYGQKAGVDRDDCDFCSLTNNLIFSNEEVTFSFATNSAGNNLENIDPLFNAPNAIGSGFTYAFDYRLQDSSPAINAASDGSQIGIYGGAYPFPGGQDVPFLTSPESQLPKLIDFNIKTAAVPEGGEIEIDFKARVSGNQ